MVDMCFILEFCEEKYIIDQTFGIINGLFKIREIKKEIRLKLVS